MRRLVGLALATACYVGPALAQTAVPALDSGFARIHSKQPGPAVAIAVWYDDRMVYQGSAGFADLEHQVPASMATRFDWASVAKQITAFAVAQLVEQGRIDPAGPARKYLPELDLGGAPVTVNQLLHHTAGLEDSDGLLVLAGGQPGDPVSLGAMARLILGQRHLRSAPGDRSSYGNSGYILLAEMVARLTGRNFAEWCDSMIFRPLGMTKTGFLARPEQLVPNRALPYVVSRDGEGLVASRDEATPGPGGLYGTVGDLVKWASHLMSPSYQRPATLRLRARGTLNTGQQIAYAWGVGWGEYRGQVTLAHSGSGPASNAFLLTIPELGFAVAAASAGETDPSVFAMAYRAADHFLAAKLRPVDPAPRGPRPIMISFEAMNERPAESKGITLEAAQLARYTGTYRLADSSILVVRNRGERLEFSYGGRPFYIPLFPLPDGRFVAVPLWNAYRFLSDSQGRVTGLAVERTAKSLRRDAPERVLGERLADRQFDPASAAPYLGVYYSDELGSAYEVALNDRHLELRHGRHGAMPLIPLEGDAFGVDGRYLAAVRFGKAGATVVGLQLEAVSWGATASFRKLPGAH